MESTFRPVPNGTIRLTSATVAGSAPLLAGLAAGSGCVVLIQNRGTVPVLVEFGQKADMTLPTAPGESASSPGSRSIPAGAATYARLQQNERHVAVAVSSGSPDVEFTVGSGGGDVFGIGAQVSGSGGGGGSGGTMAAPSYGYLVTDTAGTQPVGAPSDAAATSDTGAFGLIALAKRALGNWTTLLARIPALVSGRLPVDGSGVTQPVSGTVSALNVGISNTTPPTVANGAQGIFQLSTNGSLYVDTSRSTTQPLPTGAATSAKQSAPGTAGTPSADVLSAQGVVGGVPMPTAPQDNRSITLTASAAGPMTGTGADATTGAISTTGYLGGSFQLISAGSGNTLVVEESNDGTTWTASQAYQSNNPGIASSSSATSNTGVVYRVPFLSAFIRFRVATYGSGTLSAVFALKASPIPFMSTYVGGIGAGTNTIGALATGTNFIGNTATAASANSSLGPVPVTSTTASLLAKAGAGNLYGYSVTAGATAGFLAILNLSAVPTNGAAISPIELIPVPVNGYVARRQDIPDRYGTGLVLVFTSSATTYTPVTPALMAASVQ